MRTRIEIMTDALNLKRRQDALSEEVAIISQRLKNNEINSSEIDEVVSRMKEINEESESIAIKMRKLAIEARLLRQSLSSHDFII